MDSVKWLSQLVSFDTVSHRSNLPLIEYIQNALQPYGISTRLRYDTSGKKANLLATIPGLNNQHNGGLILSAHTDVVPVEDQTWDTDPFTLVKKGDKLYGRGTCDMKGFIAVTLALVPDFIKMKLLKPLHLAFSYDEEIGCRGAPLLIEDLNSAHISARACIVGEPTEMCPVVAHKGIELYRCRLYGQAAHSSLKPYACNAIEYAAELMGYLQTLSENLKMHGPYDKDFDVPFTSLSINMIKGGIAYNIIPDACEFTFELRYLPSTDMADLNKKIKNYIDLILLPKMTREFSAAKIELNLIASAPAFESNSQSKILQLTQNILNIHNNLKVAYATEAGFFQQASIPTLVCGPGNINQAHCANEFITLEQLKKCENFLRQITSMFCAQHTS